MTTTRDPNPYSRDQIRARIRARRERSHRMPTFYERALDASDRDLFTEASQVEGMDEEVALLRMQIRRLLEEQSDDPGAFHAGIRLLVQALSARHRLSGREAETLTDRADSFLAQFAANLAPVAGPSLAEDIGIDIATDTDRGAR